MAPVVLLGLLFAGRVTLDMNCASVGAVCAEMTRQTGEKYGVLRYLSERKLTVVAKSVPASDVQAQMADLLGAEWVEQSGQHALRLTETTLADEQRQARAEYIANRDALLDSFRFLAWCGKNTPQAIRNEPLTERTYGGDRLLRLKLPQVKGLIAYSQLPVIATGLESNLAANVKNLLDGKTLALSDEESESAIPVSRSVVRQWVQTSTLASRFLVSYDQLTHSLKVAGFFPNLSTSFVPIPEIATLALPELRDAPLSDQEATWAKANLGALDGKGAVSQVALPKSEYRSQGFGLGEYARYISRRFGVPVIADAFRIAVSAKDFGGSATLGQYVRELTQVSQTPPLWPVLGGRVRSGWLQLRHRWRWRLQPSEVPEDALNPIETAAERDEMELNDYATLASRLTPAQFASFENRPAVLVRFPARPLQAHIPYLRVWASLNSSQQKQASGDGISPSQLTGAQRQKLYDALLRDLGISIMSRDTFEAIWKGNVGADSLIFQCRQIPNPAPLVDMEPLTARMGRPIDPTTGGKVLPGTLVQFRVGTSLPDSILTAFTILKRH